METAFFVMPGLVPGIHVLRLAFIDVDGRDKPGHDEKCEMSLVRFAPSTRPAKTSFQLASANSDN